MCVYLFLDFNTLQSDEQRLLLQKRDIVQKSLNLMPPNKDVLCQACVIIDTAMQDQSLRFTVPVIFRTNSTWNEILNLFIHLVTNKQHIAYTAGSPEAWIFARKFILLLIKYGIYKTVWLNPTWGRLWHLFLNVVDLLPEVVYRISDSV